MIHYRWAALVVLMMTTTAMTKPIPANVAPAPADLDFDGRCRWMLEQFREQKIRGHQKTGLPDAVAKLALSDGQDAAARAYICKYPVKSDEFFDYPWIARAVHMWGEHFTDDEITQLRGNLAKVKDWLYHGTENHAAMRVASGYLLAQYFPDAMWRVGNEQISSEELMKRAKVKLMSRGKGFYRIGNNEQLSPSYAFLNAYPLLGLYDFAADPEVRAVAEALLIYTTATVAANSLDGHLMPPLNRRARQYRFAPPEWKGHRFTAIHHTISWLLWGQNVVYPADFTASGEPPFALFFALTTWRVPEPINRIASGAGSPYELRSVLSAFNEWGNTNQRETWRYLYRDPQFAIGAPVAQRFNPRSFFIDYDMFSIAWASDHRHRVLEAMHPYWHSNKGLDDRGGLHTPFQQVAAHRNTAIVLFDIPQADPWAKEGDEKYWVNQRSDRISDLFKVGIVRFPSTVQDLTIEGDRIAFRDGEVFLSVHVLRPGPEVDRDAVEDFIVVRSRHARTGFVIEVGTPESHGSFDAFREAVSSRSPSVDWEQLDVTYQNTTGDTLRLLYDQDLSRDDKGWTVLAPQVWVNGEARDLDTWPILASPVVTLQDGVLRVEEGSDRLTVDWSSDLPRFER